MPENKFSSLNLDTKLLENLESLNFSSMTTIQKQAIPIIMQGDDLIAKSKTGSGKTIAFGIGILQNLDVKNFDIQFLVICPTRELCEQVASELRKLARLQHNVKIVTIYGGESLYNQRRSLDYGAHIVVGTPGRIIDHIGKETIDLSKIKMLVLDEADRMLDMGFVTYIRLIHAELQKRHQTLLFSATYTDKVRKLSRLVLRKPEFVETARQNKTIDAINQHIYLVDADRKAALLSFLIGSKNYQQVLVFTKTKKSADILVEELKLDGLKAEVIHGDKTLAQRNKTLTKFKKKELHVLVATDIASRGIDIEQLPQVINYELPTVAEDYVHRIGRTGRAGHDGEAITLLDVNDKEQMKVIERLIHVKIPRSEIEGFEVDITKKATYDDIKSNRPKKVYPKPTHSRIAGEKGGTSKAPQKKNARVGKKRKTTKRSGK